MKEIRLEKWPRNGRKQLEELYENVDQQHCLVQVPLPMPEEETKAYIHAIDAGIVDEKPFLCFGIQEGDDIIGKIELSKDDKGVAELDLIIRKEYENQGVGTKALKEMMRYVEKENWCDEIEAYVNEENVAMMKVLENNGFLRQKKFKADIVVRQDDLYTLKEINGYEYTYTLTHEL